MITVICGFSASGKDSILNELVNQNIAEPIVTHTSRPKRDNETNGKEYNFITKESFLSKINNNEMVEYREYQTIYNNNKDVWYYGLEKNSINQDENQIIIMDLDGAIKLKKLYNAVIIFIYVPNKERKKRATKRDNYSEVEWNRRLQDDKKIFKSNNMKYCDYILDNHDLVECCNDIKNIINKDK